jgi:hypothetical protein
MAKSELLVYSQVLENLPPTKHLLLGNGFSIACDDVFGYTNLFEFAKDNGLNERIQGIFNYLGTNNFEGVLRLLDDTSWMIEHYGLVTKKGKVPPIKEDLQSVKGSLVKAVTLAHLPTPNKINDVRKARCVEFLTPYKTVFTTNYDLLLYWVTMHGLEKLEGRDGFRAPVDDPEAEYLVFQEHLGDEKGILFLHGAIHLYVKDGEVCKHSWIRDYKRRPIVELVKEGLDNGQYPLFVAEGLPNKKLEQIQHSGYLSYCLGKLERIQQALVIFGLSLSKSDQHICNAIADNIKLKDLYIGLFDPSNKDIKTSAKLMQERRTKRLAKRQRGEELIVHFYDSKTVPVWDEIKI